MKLTKVLTILLGGASLTAHAQSSFDESVTSVSNVGLTVTNVGTFGNSFSGNFDVIGSPSCEFPVNSGIEHLFEAGFWVGAKIDGAIVAVSTAAYDRTSGYATGAAGFEFTGEVGSQITKRSTLIDSPFFNPDAVSHEDFVCDFSDKNVQVPGTSIQINDHLQPLNIDVHLETYNWNFSFSDFFVIANYRITNSGTSTLNDVYFSMWSNEVVRNINITPAGQGGSAFYDKGGNGYIDSLRMAYCYDATGDVGFTESYIAHKFLGAEDKDGFHHPDLDPNFKANYQSWIFNNSSDPLYFIPTTELGRYNKMITGLNEMECWVENSSTNPNCGAQSISQVLNNPGNRSDLISIGPFPSLAPGESIDIAWAWVLAKKNEDGRPNSENNPAQQQNLIQNASWAQTAYNGEDVNFNGVLDEDEDKDGNGIITRFILPTPPDIPRTKVIATDNNIDIYWSDNSESSLDPISKREDFEGYRIYLSKLAFDVQGNNDLLSSLNLVSAYDAPGNGLFFETGFNSVRLESPVTFEGDTVVYTYKYTIDNVLNGWQYALALTAFDTGDELNNLESLESSRLANSFRVFAGTPANESIKSSDPFVYPNPYYGGASWEGASSFEEDRKLIFANLPERCVIRVFTVAGDLIDEFVHDQTYTGNDIRWFNTYSDPEKTVFSGGEHAWDLLSADAQIIARGVYLFSVEDLDSGDIRKGKFVIIK